MSQMSCGSTNSNVTTVTSRTKKKKDPKDMGPLSSFFFYMQVRRAEMIEKKELPQTDDDGNKLTPMEVSK